jgi:transcriptional regulator with XRE-family HTH domain
MVFNERLKRLRVEKNLVQKDIADAMHLSIRAISNYEQGIREPSLEILIKLCNYFDVSADYLIGRTDDY